MIEDYTNKIPLISFNLQFDVHMMLYSWPHIGEQHSDSVLPVCSRCVTPYVQRPGEEWWYENFDGRDEQQVISEEDIAEAQQAQWEQELNDVCTENRDKMISRD